ADPRFATNPERLATRDELVPLLASRIAERGRDELLAAFMDADVPAGPVNQVSEALAAMEAAHDGAWVQERDGMRLAPDPMLFDSGRLPLRLAPPKLGEHTDEILGEAGLAPAEIAELRTLGAIA
ncbi:MAG: CoA transferase, partial [Chloroflexota bacterium]